MAGGCWLSARLRWTLPGVVPELHKHLSASPGSEWCPQAALTVGGRLPGKNITRMPGRLHWELGGGGERSQGLKEGENIKSGGVPPGHRMFGDGL